MRKSNRLAELDALRGVAALLVVFFHYTMGRPEAALGFKMGITGVDLFFVISGFVTSMSIVRVNRDIDFVVNRVSRLYPAYWIAVSFTFLLIIIQSILLYGDLRLSHFLQYLANLTMFQFYLNEPDLDGPYWSLIVEMVFYASILLLFHFRQLKRINAIGVILIATTVLVQQFFWSYELKVFLHITILLKYLPLFLAGNNFYHIYTSKEGRRKRYAIIAFCFLSQVLMFKHCARARVFISQKEYIAALAVIFTLFTLFVNGYLKFVANRVTLFFGRISYPLYLTHQFLALSFIFPVLINHFELNFWVASFGITLPINILLAYFVTVWFDEPLSRKMKDKLRNLQAVQWTIPQLKQSH